MSSGDRKYRNYDEFKKDFLRHIREAAKKLGTFIFGGGSATDGQTLIYDASTGKWVNTDFPVSVSGSNIYNVDSINGTDSPGSSSYQTLDYAISDIDNVNQILVTRGAGTYTLTNISDANNALISEGDLVEAMNGIFSYGTYVVSKGNEGGNVNTVLLSQPTLGGGGGTSNTRFYTPIILNVSGNQVVTSSIYKQGVYIVNYGTITADSLTLLDVSTEIPTIPYYFENKGYITLKGSTSRLYYESSTSSGNVFNHICNLDFGNVYSEGIDIQIFVNRYSLLYGNYIISACKDITIFINNVMSLNIKSEIGNSTFQNIGNITSSIGIFTKATFDKEFDNTTLSGSQTIDWNKGQNQKVTLDGDIDITFTPILNSGTFRTQMKFIQDSTGGRNVTFTDIVENPSEFDFSSGGANQVCIATFYYDGERYWVLSTSYITLTT